jgi:hypothetical protein
MALGPVTVAAFLAGNGTLALMDEIGGVAIGSVPPPQATSIKELSKSEAVFM